MRGAFQRNFAIAAVALGVSLVGSLIVGNAQAGALSGTGYFSGDPSTCTISVGLRLCGDISPPYTNDVVLGRPGTTPAVPDFGNNKTAYVNWVVGEWNAGGTRREAARFIIGSMLGDRNAANNTTELMERFQNPALTMTKVFADPNAYGSISFRGKTQAMATDFFWTSAYDGSAGNMYVFRVAGSDVYVLEQNCGNPVGLPGKPGVPDYDPENWSLTARSGIRGPASSGNYAFNGTTLTQGKVGQTYYWAHSLYNNGPTDMQTGVTYIVDRTVRDESGNLVNSPFNNDLNDNPTLPYDTGDTTDANEYLYNENGDGGFWGMDKLRYTVASADGGRTICQRMAALPGSRNNGVSGDWVRAEWACVRVPFDYDIKPYIDVPTSVVESETAPVSITTRVDHTGTYSRDTQWRIVKLVFNSSTPDPSGSGSGQSNNAPCTHFTGEVSCNDTWWQSTPNPIIFTGDFNENINTTLGTDFNLNTRVCYATAVSRPTHRATDPAWAYSDLKCVVTAKRPKVQFWGGDIRVGNSYSAGQENLAADIRTVNSTDNGRTYGSWGEYGMLTPTNGDIQSVTGGALSGTDGADSATALAANLNRLSFANTSIPYGRWGTPGLFPQLTSEFMSRVATQTTAGDVNLTSIGGADAKEVISMGSGKVSGNVPGNVKYVIILSSGTVTIDQDIRLTNTTLTSADQAQQVVIIARNIIIENDVTDVDAWLIARPQLGGGGVLLGGTVSTCDTITPAGSRFYQGLHVGHACDQRQLRINGPIMAHELQLKRTYGASDTTSLGEPGEILNMRADAYLWMARQGEENARIDTMSTRELPPRF